MQHPRNIKTFTRTVFYAYEQQNGLPIDYDIYLREASRGRSFLAVRPAGYAQLKQTRALLAPHHAYLARYIDTWTLTELLP